MSSPKMLHIAPKMSWIQRPSSPERWRVRWLEGGGGGVSSSVERWASRGRRRSCIFAALYAEDDVLLGAAPCVLAKEQTGCETGRLAHHGDMIRLPHLAVFVHQSVTRAGRAVPDALLGPNGWMTGGVSQCETRKQKNEWELAITKIFF